MRSNTPLAAACGLFALWLGAVGRAQAPTPPVPASATEEPLLLSPFEVVTARDNGFVPSSTLAGGRLATDLQDTPVAYSVITRDLIEALNLTDLGEAAQWSPNTVIAIASNGGGFGDDVSNAPASYNVRGAGNGRQQRNFFIYNAPMDSYSVERFDFGRGPNAVLFGNGSLGGVSSTTTKQARFDRRFGAVSFGGGSWDRYRSTLDFNQPLTGRLAVRGAAVWKDFGGWRDRQFDKNKALFLTGTFKVSRNTSIRLEGETGLEKRNQTFTNITDQFSGWDGKTTFSGRLDTLPANANAIGVGRRASNYIVYDPFSGVNAVMKYENEPMTLGGGANSQVPIGGFLQGSLPGFNTANATLLYALNVPAKRFDNAIGGSEFRVPGPEFTTAFDIHTIQQRYKDLQLTVDHRIGDVFLQFAIDSNRTRQSINTPDVRNAGQTFIDINRVLPNGAPNPHYLQPYNDSLFRRTEDGRDSDGVRLAVGTTRDLGRWGRYTFNVMGGYTKSYDIKYGAYLLSIAQNADRRRWGASGSGLGRTDAIWFRSYWNEPRRPYAAPGSIRYIEPITGVDKTITPRWALESDRSDSFQDADTRYTYGIAAMTAKLFKNKLVVLGAIRGDDFRNLTRQQLHGGDYSPTDYDASYGIYKPAAPADYASLTYQLKDATGRILGPPVSADTRPRDGNGNRLAQYANDRFKDDYNAPEMKKRQYTPSVGAVVHVTPWLSPYVNYAETFNPPSIIQRIDSSFLQPTVAKGLDVGVRLQLLLRLT